MSFVKKNKLFKTNAKKIFVLKLDCIKRCKYKEKM
jgi:hypothetical protein